MGRENQSIINKQRVKVAIYTNHLDNGGISKYVYNLHDALLLEQIDSDIVTFHSDTIYGEHIKLLSCHNHWQRVKKLRQYIKSKSIKFIISNTWFEALIAKIASFGIKGIKVYSVVHIRPNLWGFSSNDVIRKTLSKLSLAWCDQVIAVSNELCQAMIKEGLVEEDHIQTIYNPVIFNEESVTVIPMDLKVKDTVEIAIIGWIQPRKAQDVIVKAFSRVNNRNFCLNFIGGVDDKSYKQQVQDLIEKYQLNKNVKFWGPQKDVFSILKKMDLLVTASRGEALPTVMIEALSCAVPIISSDCDYGPKEILDNGKYGLLFEVDNDQQLCDCYQTMVNNAELYQQFIELSVQRGQLFTAREAAKKYKMLFDEIGREMS